MITRRGIIAGVGALIAAPAIVRAGSIMPVKAVKLGGMLDGWDDFIKRNPEAGQIGFAFLGDKSECMVDNVRLNTWSPLDDLPIKRTYTEDEFALHWQPTNAELNALLGYRSVVG